MTLSEPPPISNPLNVYRGKDALQKFYDPDCSPPTPLVQIPAALNPYEADGVRIFAKLHSALPATNIKSLPALNMLRESGFGKAEHKALGGSRIRRIVEYSSGSTVISLAILGNIFGLEGVSAYLSNKTSAAKIKLMRFFGLDLHFFGGPSQPEPYDERGGIQAARRHAQDDPTVINPNQYENEANFGAHIRWTAPQILKQLPEVNIVVAGMGTAGTMTGIGLALKSLKPDVIRVGVTTAPGDRVPGPRSEALLAPVTFPWREAIDSMQWVTSTDAYSLSLQLCRTGLLVGPSSGFNLKGLYQHLEELKQSGKLEALRGHTGTGELNAVFICCDGPFQYIDEYMTKLPGANFGTLYNEELLGVDAYRYDDAWELDATGVLTQLYRSRSLSQATLSSSSNASDSPEPMVAPHLGPLILDLRTKEDSAVSPWPMYTTDARNLPLKTLGRATPCPFKDSSQLRQQWLELKQLLVDGAETNGVDRFLKRHDGERPIDVLVLCYTGNTSRVATSVLRHHGYPAWSLKGGMLSWQEQELV
ncbi:unnamed protein product [Parajaminaea phylloscopi]